MWSALNEIAAKEGCSIHDLCGAVHDMKEDGASFTATLRSFMLDYFRANANVSPNVSLIQQKLRDSRTAKTLTREARI